ncbi:MAG: hypothetical protein AB8F65_06700 [Woeseiaceae bacterium]
MDNNDDILKAAAALPRSIEPSRDLWPGIESQLQTEKTGFWQWRVAASGLAASMLIGLLLLPPVDDKPPVAAVEQSSVPSLNAQLVRHIPFDQAFMRDYERSLEQLDAQLAQMPPGTREVIVGNLKIVRESIRDINEEIDRDPNNVQLRQLLQLAYRQEMAIISMVRESALGVEQVRTTT